MASATGETVDRPDPPEAKEPPPFLGSRPAFLEAARRLGVWIRGTSQGYPWRHVAIVAAALAGVYLVGYGIAIASGQVALYLGYIVVPLVLAEIGWAVVAMDWLRDQYRSALWAWRLNFGEAYEGVLRDYWTRLTESRSSRAFSGSIALIAAAVPLAMRETGGSVLGLQSIAGPIVAAAPGLMVLFVLLAAGLGYVAGWGGYLILEHIRFLQALARMDLNPYRVLTGESQIEEIGRLSFVSSLAWFAAVALATLVLYRHLSAGALGLYAVALVIGFASFLLPQLSLHHILVSAKKELIREYRNLLPEGWQSRPAISESVRVMTILNLIRAVDGIPEWPVDVRVVASELIAALLPVAAALLAPSVGGL